MIMFSKSLLILILITSTNAWWWRRRRSVPCKWKWTACTRSCGGGTMKPTITRPPKRGGKCKLPRAKACNTQSCSVNETKCDALKGVCQLNNKPCEGTYVYGKCSGPSNRQCCEPAGKCTLVRYTGTNVNRYRSQAIRIEPSFVSYMNKINNAAKNCSVTVYVTSSFRKDKQPISGAIVTPSKISNHLVGHAIDMNLQTSSGWCNSACLQKKVNKGAKCFINSVKANGVRWGGDFSIKDPVLLDDKLNLSNRSRWNELFKTLQNNC